MERLQYDALKGADDRLVLRRHLRDGQLQEPDRSGRTFYKAAV